jgi:hypothetical protein
MRGGEYGHKYDYEPDNSFKEWWGQEPGKMSWDEFLNWYIQLRCGKEKTGLTEGPVFESWVNNLPRKVYSELRKAFDGSDYYPDQWIGALYREMTRGGNQHLVMTAAATKMNKKNYNEKINEMLHRLHNKTWYPYECK